MATVRNFGGLGFFTPCHSGFLSNGSRERETSATRTVSLLTCEVDAWDDFIHGQDLIARLQYKSNHPTSIPPLPYRRTDERQRERMEHPYSSGGNWMVIPNNPNQIPSSSNVADHSQIHHHIHHPQQLHHLHQQHQQHQLQHQQQNHLQSVASHFHMLHLVESLAEATENGSRDQNSDALVAELTSQFDKCQQLLTSISGSIGSKVMTVEGQKQKLEECEQLLNQRRDVIAKYKSSVDELVRADYS